MIDSRKVTEASVMADIWDVLHKHDIQSENGLVRCAVGLACLVAVATKDTDFVHNAIVNGLADDELMAMARASLVIPEGGEP
jgi:hypothetical protein